jgi:hypothetical protein
MSKNNHVDEPGLGKDIRGYTIGQLFDRRDPHDNTAQFDREIDDRASKSNSWDD